MKRVIILASVIGLSVSLYAGEIFVKKSASGANNGTSWTDAYTDLKTALGSATYGDSILVASDTYYPSSNDSTVYFTISDSVYLYGGFAGNEDISTFDFDTRDFSANPTILSGDINMDDDTVGNNENTGHVVYIYNNDSTVIDGFTIAGGNTSGSGTVDKDGGGVYVYNSTAWLRNLTLRDNYSAANGGAISSYGSKILIEGCLIYNNNSSSDGGAIHLQSNTVSKIVNTTIVKNETNISSGAGSIYLWTNNTLEVINTIIWDNNKTYDDISVDIVSSTITYQNCLLENSGGSGSWDTNFGTDAGSNIDTYPYFVSTLFEDYRLTDISPAIDTGNVTYGNNIGYYQDAGVPFQEYIYVNDNAAGSNNGTSWTNAFNYLDTALYIAEYGQKIAVASGIYTPSDTNRTESFNLKNGVELYGGFDGTENLSVFDFSARNFEANKTILSGDLDGDDDGFTNNTENSYHIVRGYMVDSTSVLDGFTITGGNANGSSSAEKIGAAIYNSFGGPTFQNIVVHTNYATYNGAGMYNSSSSPAIVMNASFYNNKSAQDGGAILNYSGSQKFINVTIVNNQSTGSTRHGGGMYNDLASPTLINVLMWDNTPDNLYDRNSASSKIEHSLIENSGGSSSWNLTYSTDNGNNIDTLPYIVNTITGDLSLYDNSPAINAGNVTYGNNIGHYQGSGSSLPSPLYVSESASGSNDGSSWANAFNELYVAIDSAIPHQNIVVAKGTYKPDPSLRTNSLQIKNYVGIYGSFAGDESVINDSVLNNRDFFNNASILSGDLNDDDSAFTYMDENVYHVVYSDYNNAHSILDGFIITGGNANGTAIDKHDHGGAIYNNYSKATYKNLFLYKNYSNSSGAGINSYYSSTSSANITIAGNKANTYWGGAINSEYSADQYVNILIWDNEATSQNFVYSTGTGDPTFSYSLLEGSGGSSSWNTYFGTNGGNNIDSDPYLVGIDTADYRLYASSPAIAAGDSNYANNIGLYQGNGLPRPYVRLTESITNFGSILNGEISNEQSYVVEGGYLTDSVLIVAPEAFEISLTSGDYSGNVDTIVLYPDVDTIEATTIYVRFAPETIMTFIRYITHSSTDALDVKLQLNGTSLKPTLIYVDENAAGKGTGSTWNNAFIELRDALDLAASSDTVVVAKGTYTPLGRAYSFDIVDQLKLWGGFDGTETTFDQTALDNRNLIDNETILSGDILGNDDGMGGNISENSYHVLTFDQDGGISSSTIVDGFTISGGNANYLNTTTSRGGGIYMQGGFSADCRPTIQNCIIKNNNATNGGGLYGDAVIGDAFVIGPTINNVKFYNNTASYGGAMYFSSLDQTTIAPLITNCDFIENSAINGGTIYIIAGSTDYGGTANSTIRNCSFYNNSATGSGYSLYNSVQNDNSTITNTLINTIMWDDYSANQIKTYIVSGVTTGTATNNISYSNIIGSDANTTWNSEYGTNAGNNIEADPVFTEPDSLDLSLLDISPCIGVGNATYGDNMGSYQSAGEPGPEISISGSISGFGDVDVGTTSTEQSLTISGSNLLGNIIVNAPSAFEVSVKTGTEFSNAITLTPANKTISDTTVYVRFKPTKLIAYNDSISIITKYDTVYIQVSGTGSGELVPIVDIDNNIGEFDTTDIGKYSNIHYFTVDGVNMDTSVYIRPPSGFKVSLNYSLYFTESFLELMPEGDSTIPSATVYVRFEPTEAKVYNDSIKVWYGNDSTYVKVTAVGVEGPPSELVVAPTTIDFGSVEFGMESSEQQIQISGTNLKGDVTVKTPSHFKSALYSYGGYSNDSIVFYQSNGTLNTSYMYVKFTPYVSGNITDSILVYTKDDSVYVTLTGTVTGTATSIVNISDVIFDFGSVEVGDTSHEEQFQVNGYNLTSDVAVIPPEGIEVSTQSGTGFSSDTLFLSPVSNEIHESLYLHFIPDDDSYFYAAVKVESEDTTLFITINGQGTISNYPQLTVNAMFEYFGDISVNQYSEEQSFTVSGMHILDSITILVSEGFQLTTISGDYTVDTSQVVLHHTNGIVEDTIYVRFAPTEIRFYTGQLQVFTKLNSSYSSFDGRGAEPLGINEILVNNLAVFPNPVQNTLYINSLEMPEKLLLYNAQQQLVLTKTNGNLGSINVQHLPAGVYILNTVFNNKTVLNKIVIVE